MLVDNRCCAVSEPRDVDPKSRRLKLVADLQSWLGRLVSGDDYEEASGDRLDLRRLQCDLETALRRNRGEGDESQGLCRDEESHWFVRTKYVSRQSRTRLVM